MSSVTAVATALVAGAGAESRCALAGDGAMADTIVSAPATAVADTRDAAVFRMFVLFMTIPLGRGHGSRLGVWAGGPRGSVRCDIGGYRLGAGAVSKRYRPR